MSLAGGVYMPKSSIPFQLPNVPYGQKLTNCLKIIENYRKEIIPLRKQVKIFQKSNQEGLVKHWREKYEKSEEENKKLKQEKKQLEIEKEKLKKEIEKLTKTNNRYQIGLFDHGNFKHPDSKKKQKGGQIGHANTNKDHKRNYATFPRQRIFAISCGSCGNTINRTNSFKNKTLIDIQLNTELIQLIIQSERQWCGNCRNEIRAIHPQSLPFTEYGINTFMTILYLRFKGKQSIRTISTTLISLFRLPITKSGVDTILLQAKEYLQGRYEELKQAIRDGEIMYNDETGWMVRGKNAWMWIMATPDKEQTAGSTVYVAAESKGKGIFEEMYGNSNACSMHDGNSSYESITGIEKSLYCWSHVIRYAYEETVKLPKGHIACQIRDRLVNLYQEVRGKPERIRDEKEKLLREELDNILSIQSTGQTVKNIQNRVRTQKQGLTLSLLLTSDGTNNLAEREFRQLVISRTISYGSDTYAGMERTAILSSIIQTISRDKTKLLFPTLASYLRDGIKDKYSNYWHTPNVGG